MELWIRSQDKMRIFKMTLDVSIIPFRNEKGETEKYIIGCNDYEMNYEIGSYKTKERAIEVLDEINDYKDKLEKAYFLGMQESVFVSSTFVMPKE